MTFAFGNLRIQVDICLWQSLLQTRSSMVCHVSSILDSQDWIHLVCIGCIPLKLLHLRKLLCLSYAPIMHLSSTEEDKLKVISDCSLGSAFVIISVRQTLRKILFIWLEVFYCSFISFFVFLLLPIWVYYVPNYKQELE